MFVSDGQSHPYFYVGGGSVVAPFFDDGFAHGEIYMTGFGFRRDHKRGKPFIDLGVVGWIDGSQGVMLACSVGFLFNSW
jgi:hypothetical protein